MIDNETIEFTTLNQAYHYLILSKHNPETQDAIRDAALEFVSKETERSLTLSPQQKTQLREIFYALATEDCQ